MWSIRLEVKRFKRSKNTIYSPCGIKFTLHRDSRRDRDRSHKPVSYMSRCTDRRTCGTTLFFTMQGENRRRSIFPEKTLKFTVNDLGREYFMRVYWPIGLRRRARRWCGRAWRRSEGLCVRFTALRSSRRRDDGGDGAGSRSSCCRPSVCAW